MFPDSRLNYAKATYESRYGRIESGWKYYNGDLKVSVVIPPNVTAEITLDNTSLSKVKENGKPIISIFKNAKEVNGNVLLEVGSGNYEFIISQDLK